MPTKLKHYSPSQHSLTASWRVMDAKGKVLGRFASEIATALMGKDKPGYVPHLLSGDFVVVVNASKIALTGDKAQQKEYRRHSQYPGNLKVISYAKMSETAPERVVELAVKGMLPKNKLGRKLLTRLKVYAGQEHPHMAQVIGSERAAMQREQEAADPVVPVVGPQLVEEQVEPSTPDAYETPISELALPTRAKTALSAHGLETVGDLVEMGSSGLSRDVSGFGAKSLSDLIEVLGELGVELED